MRTTPIRRLPVRFTASLLGTVLLLTTSASPALAAFEWEGSRAESITARSLDVLIVRPLASARVLIGSVLMLPAALLASPGGKEGIDGAYEVLLAEPIEYAFKRELGEF